MDSKSECFFTGCFLTMFIFLVIWASWGGPVKTISGKFILKTHYKVYHLVSDESVKIGTDILQIEDKKEKGV